MSNLIDNSVYVDHVVGDVVSNRGKISSADVISSEDVDKVSVNMAGLDVLGSSDVVPDLVENSDELSRVDGLSKDVVDSPDSRVSNDRSDVLVDLLVRPLTLAALELLPRGMSSSETELVFEGVLDDNLDDHVDDVAVSNAHSSQVAINVSLEVADRVVHSSIMHPVMQMEDDSGSSVSTILPLDGVVNRSGGSVPDNSADLLHEGSLLSGSPYSDVVGSDSVPRFVGSS